MQIKSRRLRDRDSPLNEHVALSSRRHEAIPIKSHPQLQLLNQSNWGINHPLIDTLAHILTHTRMQQQQQQQHQQQQQQQQQDTHTHTHWHKHTYGR